MTRMLNSGLIESNFKRTRTLPIAVPQTRRMVDLRGLTSLPAGKMVPLQAFPVLREDMINRAKIRYSFEMMESAEILMNAINVRVMAYFVPWLALARFEGSMDQLNRSYQKVPQIEGGSVVPFVETHVKGADGAEEIYTYAGMHAKEGDSVNTMFRESYNQIWNFRARNRSAQITEALLTNTDLLPAFWMHRQFQHVVPNFDEDLIDGEVALNIVDAKLPVKTDQVQDSSLGIISTAQGDALKTMYHSTNLKLGGTTQAAIAAIYAEMQDQGITISLSKIEQARKMAAFARMKEQFEGVTDEYIIDLLMQGISVPDQALKQPILMADKTTVFGMQKRYATDAGNLAESAVNGATFIDLNLRLPKMNVGGTVMVVAEITPEQLFERQKDPYFYLSDVEELPNYLRDTLDDQKVEYVTNSMVDVDHSDPNATFGYGPLNWRWNTQIPRIGGKFYRPDSAATFDEDRQRLWVTETQDPTFSEDFYLSTNINQSVFQDTLADPFECVGMGVALITGNTVFGTELHEASNLYEQIQAEAPTDRIEQE